LKFLRTRLGRLMRDIRRKIEGDAELEAAFAVPLGKALQIRGQRQNQRGWKLYSWHAPEVECIGKGKARTPPLQGFPSSPRSPRPGAASSCSTPRPCTATRSMATPWAR